MAHVFVLNDWSGLGADSRDPNRTTGIFMTKGIGQTGIRYLWMGLLALSLLLLSPFGAQTLMLKKQFNASANCEQNRNKRVLDPNPVRVRIQADRRGELYRPAR